MEKTLVSLLYAYIIFSWLLYFEGSDRRVIWLIEIRRKFLFQGRSTPSKDNMRVIRGLQGGDEENSSECLFELFERDLSSLKLEKRVVPMKLSLGGVISQRSAALVSTDFTQSHNVSIFHGLADPLNSIFYFFGCHFISLFERLIPDDDLLAGGTCEFFSKIEHITVVKSFIAGVVICICFFNQEGPNIDTSMTFNIDKGR